MATTLVRHEVIMKRRPLHDVNAFVCYEAQSHDGEETEDFYLSRQNYADMGEPNTITVTIVPGDTLNGGE